MADKEFKYTLEFQSTATGTGGKQTVETLQAVEKSTGALTAKQADLRAEFAAVSNRFDVTRTAAYNLDEALKGTVRDTATLTPGITNVKNAIGNRNAGAAQSLYVFSQGFEDLQYGVRGVLNNVPQLVFALGGSAGLAGAISIAAVAGNALYRMLDNTSQKASEVNDDLAQTATNMGDILAEDLTKPREAIKAATEESKQLRQDWTETTKADNAYATASFTNAETIRTVGDGINVMLGIRLDKLRELKAIEDAAAAKRQTEADQALAAEQKRLKNAQDNVTDKVAEQLALQAQSEKDKEILASKIAQLEALQKQKIELQRIASQTVSLGEALTPDGNGGGLIIPGSKTPEAAKAQGQLDNPVFQNQLAGLSKEVDALRTQLAADAKDLNRTRNDLISLDNVRADLAQSVSTNSATILQNFETADIKGKFEAAGAKTKEVISGVEASFTGIQTQNEEGKLAVERIKTAISDGVLTAKEQAQLSRDMVTLIGLLQSGQAANKTSVQQMISTQTSTNAELVRMNAELVKLQSQIGQGGGR